jgi:adenosylcobyric acid synthase
MGVSDGPSRDLPAFYIGGRAEGARSRDDLVMGTYLHGLFDTPQALSALLRWAGLDSDVLVDLGHLREQSLDRIADASAPLLEALLRR